MKNLGKTLSRNEMRNVYAGIVYGGDLKSWKCCAGGHCGPCATSTGIPTCSTGYTLTEC